MSGFCSAHKHFEKGCLQCETAPASFRGAETPQPSAGLDGCKAALDAIEKAEKHVHDLCDGSKKWTMRVPVDPDRDSDIIICDALAKARKIIAAL